jgi:D-3-phosphoglycerate dehydrogenase
MNITVLDDYQGMVRKLDAYKLVASHNVTIWNDHTKDEDLLAERLKDTEALVLIRERTPIRAPLIARLPKLKIISQRSVYPHIDVPACTQHGVVVCSNMHAGTPSYAAAELTWAMVLGLARQITVEDRNMREGRWQTSVGFRLEGRTLGLIGLGTLGARVARYGQAFDMRVVAWSANLDPQRARYLGVEPVTKEELLRQSDVVSIHLKLGDRSRGLIGAPELALMKRSAILVNTSRGPIIDQEALAQALQNGVIAGAALDVFEPEPLPADHPVRRLPNTILTPHIGFVTEESYREFFAGIVEAIVAWRQASADL